MSDLIRLRLDDLRRHALELSRGVGLAPARATILVDHLLWFDAAAASSFGIATLPRWLDRIAAHQFDTTTEGKVMTERNGTAVLDGQNGLPPVVLHRAAEVAVEKARDAGVGVVRVTRLAPTGPAAGVAADLACGPWVAAIVGPAPSWSLALPSHEGLPVVFDSALLGSGADPAPAPAPAPFLSSVFGPWTAVLAPEGGWLIAAVAVTAWEALPHFHARVKAALGDPAPEKPVPVPGPIRPEFLEARRHEVREQGVPIAPAAWSDLTHWAKRLGIAPLVPASH